MNDNRRVIGGDVNANAHGAKSKAAKPKPGALVEDETLVGHEDGGVRTRQPDGKIDEGATDKRENRAH